MDSQDKKDHIIKGLVIVAITIAIMVVLSLVSNAITAGLINTNEGTTKNAQLNNSVLIDDIKASEVYYIDESVINVPLSVPYEISPSDATNSSIYLISSDTSIVKVNDDNTITALKTGEAVVTLVANDGSNVTTEVKVVIE